VSKVEVWHPDNFDGGWGKFQDPPATLDWNMWVGPMRWLDYNPEYVFFAFRWLLDSGGGFIRDRGTHALNIVSWCCALDDKNPVTVEATGDPYTNTVFDAPKRLHARWQFKDPDIEVTWDQPGNRYGIEWGEKFIGDKDTLLVSGGDGGCDTEQKAKDFKVPAGGVEVERSTDHRANWMECIRTRKKPISDINSLVNVVYMPVLALIAYQVGRKLQWDPKNHRFIGDEEANRFLSQPYRYPWKL
jgi:predicted dehydrogenase